MLIEKCLKRQVKLINIIEIQMPSMSKASGSMKEYEIKNKMKTASTH